MDWKSKDCMRTESPSGDFAESFTIYNNIERY